MLLWLALSARMCVLACQDQHTLPKWNILSSCYCGLLSLLVCVYWPARTSTPSQSEIFSQSYFCRECRKMLFKLLLWLALSARMCVLACQDQHTLPKWNILSSCYCGLLSLLVCVYWPARTSTPSQSEIFSQSYFCCECRKMLLWLALSARMCVLACQDQHTLPKWNILSSCYCGLLSLLVCVYWPARTSTPSQSEIFSQAVIVACSLCSYVCIGLPGPAHPPKVKYSLKLLLWLALSARMCVLACQDQHTLPKWNILSKLFLSWVSKDVIVACSLCSYVCIGLPGPAHPPKVKYSLKSKDVIVACSLCSYVCIGLPGPAHPPKVKYSLKASVERCYCGLLSLLVCVYWPARTSTPSQSEIFSQSYFCRECRKMLLWLALSARMCVLACQDQHTLPKWNILSSCYCGLLSLLVCVYWPARTSTPSQSEIFSQSYFCRECRKIKDSIQWFTHRSAFVSCRVVSWSGHSIQYPTHNCIGFMSSVSKDVIVACSLCSYVCIGLPGPAHPPKVKYSLKAIFVVSVERSKTAYNSLHIDCIGFMSWVSKDAF